MPLPAGLLLPEASDDDAAIFFELLLATVLPLAGEVELLLAARAEVDARPVGPWPVDTPEAETPLIIATHVHVHLKQGGDANIGVVRALHEAKALRRVFACETYVACFLPSVPRPTDQRINPR